MEDVAWPADLGDRHDDGKDKKLVEIVRAELKQCRRCVVYPQFTGVHDVREKLVKLLGARAVIMPGTVKPEAREDWIGKHLNEIDVLIVHPKRVMTGLDLIEFPNVDLVSSRLFNACSLAGVGARSSTEPDEAMQGHVLVLQGVNPGDRAGPNG